MQRGTQSCGKEIQFTKMNVVEKSFQFRLTLVKVTLHSNLGVYIMLDSRCTCCICFQQIKISVLDTLTRMKDLILKNSNVILVFWTVNVL